MAHKCKHGPIEGRKWHS